MTNSTKALAAISRLHWEERSERHLEMDVAIMDPCPSRCRLDEEEEQKSVGEHRVQGNSIAE
jgi:hypothetical protein